MSYVTAIIRLKGTEDISRSLISSNDVYIGDDNVAIIVDFEVLQDIATRARKVFLGTQKEEASQESPIHSEAERT